MEVDKETGRVLLKYAHGDLEWVQPNIIKEALITQSEETNGSLHSFKRILDHRSGPYGRTEVQILWDTDEVTWEPVEIIRKDDPITMAKYAKDKHLTEQQGWT